MEPASDGFRNFFRAGQSNSPTEMMVERAKLLTLTVPEMTVLVGGLRTLNANVGQTATGILTEKPGTLSTDFFANLLDMSTKWSKSATTEGIYEGTDRQTGKLKWTATPVDLMFGSSAELRAIAEVYAAADGKDLFARDFAKAWAKVMNLDRIDLR
jgi:catalase-peroxidase